MKALKEWASIVEAMLDGAQTVILRKGGILDAPSGLGVSAGDMFALYPTYEHQGAEHVKDRGRPYLDRAQAARSGQGAGATIVRACARVEAESDVYSDAAIGALAGMHVWSDAYIDARRRWRPGIPVKAAYIRVYRLHKELLVPDRPEYGGCRSWIDVEPAAAAAQPRGVDAEPGAGGGAEGPGIPVLGDREAAAGLERFREAVSL